MALKMSSRCTWICRPNSLPFAHRHGYHPAGALHGVALPDALVGTQDHDGDRLLLQILCHAVGAVGKFHQFTGHAVIQPGDLRNAVANDDHNAGLAFFQLVGIVFDLLTDDFRNFFGS